MMDIKALEDLENAQVYVKYEPLNDGASSITINTDGINLIGGTPTPYTPYPINFPTIGELDLYTHHDGCDIICDSLDALRYAVEDIKDKKEGENMKLLNMYVEKSQENIRNYYQNLIEMEEKNDIVKEDYDYIVEKYKKDMKELAERYNEVNSPTGSFIIIEPAFGMESRFKVVHKTTEKEEMYYKLRDEELKQLREKIEEVQAQLEIITNDENSSYHDINYVLHNYGIIDDNGKLTPYNPTFVDEEAPVKEAPKKVGRPKKVSK